LAGRRSDLVFLLLSVGFIFVVPTARAERELRAPIVSGAGLRTAQAATAPETTTGKDWVRVGAEFPPKKYQYYYCRVSECGNGTAFTKCEKVTDKNYCDGSVR